MHKSLAIIVAASQILIWLLAVGAGAEEGSPTLATRSPSLETLAFFETKIRPLLIERCIDCHSDDSPESGLSLESHAGIMRGGELGPAVVPGKPKESLLISAINHDEFLKMPPKEKLDTADVVNLAEWVKMGAPWPSSEKTGDAPPQPTRPAAEENDSYEFTDEQRAFWAYQPVVRPELPTVHDRDWIRSPIDRFVLDKLEAQGLAPAPPADRRDLIRRATYDLIGLPPSQQEIQAFLEDRSPAGFEAVIDRLLASPLYGERWGRHWLDVARFADSNGLDENIAYANAFRYRDYVISSFNADKPYDRFVQEQIAGDLLSPESCANGLRRDSFERYIATGFLTIGAKMLAEDDPVKMQMDIVDEQLNTLCQAFMGMTIGCARCHDHKFDPLPTADYYSLAGIFKSTQTMENYKVVAKWFERPLVTDDQRRLIDEIDSEIDSTTDALANLQKTCRQRAAQEIRENIAAALLATAELNAFDALAIGNPPAAQLPAETPCAVVDGYALLQADEFQRGTVERETDNYGKGIGVVISRGAAFAEYDLVVRHAGTYVLEMRYAAASSRPLRLLVNDVEIASAIAGNTTGGWQPENQAWSVEAEVELQAGRNVLKLASDNLFPHVDRFALVLAAGREWPFANSPASLSRICAERGVALPIATAWRDYLSDRRRRLTEGITEEIAEETHAAEPEAFAAWFRFQDISSDFASSAQRILQELDEDSVLARRTPGVLRDALLAAEPQSLGDVARTYQSVFQSLLTADSKEQKAAEGVELTRQLLDNASPLAGPTRKVELFYSPAEQQQASRLNGELADLRQRRPEPPMAMGASDGEPQDVRIHLRGSHIVLGSLVPRQFPRILAGEQQAPIGVDRSGRLEFAQWLTDSKHPLTSRVMANRIWYWHFGRGIVSSVDNFGFLGQRPTHPELLDWLANKFVEDNWSIKSLHRAIMLSQTYQMSTRFNERAAEIDPENNLLHRFRRRRLSAEETRDSIIDIGAGLDAAMYGSTLNVENHKYVNSTNSAMTMYSNTRRSVYLPVIRSGVFDVLQTLDFPDPAMLSGQRQTSTVAPQALLMMNSDLVSEHTRIVARQLLSRHDADAQRIQHAYQRILKRAPSPDEVIAAAAFIRDARSMAESEAREQESTPSSLEMDTAIWQSLCRVLVSSNEFSYIE